MHLRSTLYHYVSVAVIMILKTAFTDLQLYDFLIESHKYSLLVSKDIHMFKQKVYEIKWTFLRIWRIVLCCSCLWELVLWCVGSIVSEGFTCYHIQRWNPKDGESMFFRKDGIIYQTTPCHNKGDNNMNLVLITRNIAAGRSVFEIVNFAVKTYTIGSFFLFPVSILRSPPTPFLFLCLPPLYKVIGHILCSFLDSTSQTSYSIRS